MEERRYANSGLSPTKDIVPVTGQSDLKSHHRVRVLQTKLIVSAQSTRLREETADVLTSEAALADNRLERSTNPQIT